MADRKRAVYDQLIETLFFKHYNQGDEKVSVDRTEFVEAASDLGINLPKNLGDVIYTYRYRRQLPQSILETSDDGSWVLVGSGRGRYTFEKREAVHIFPNKLLVLTKIPDATPSVIRMYSASDEQALLAKLRYNRLIDLFTGITCYSLQNHLRTTVAGIGQVETDEIYIGIDRGGAHYVLPVQAKGGSDLMGIVQIEQDILLCAERFPKLICRAIGAQFVNDDTIALFEFADGEAGVGIVGEQHYLLVDPSDLTESELLDYRTRSLHSSA